MQMYLFTSFTGEHRHRSDARRERRRRRVGRLPRVHARPLEPPDHVRGRLGRARRVPVRRDGRGLERLVRDGLPRRRGLRARTRAPSARSRSTATSATASRRSAPRGSTARSRRRTRPARAATTRARRAATRSATWATIWSGGPEVHADGEIWAQTLWDLRSAVGVGDARFLVTEAMRLSPREPVLPRHAQRDPAGEPGRGPRTAAPTTRRRSGRSSPRRGMGYFAATEDADDTAPIESFALPPDPGDGVGSLAGTVTDVGHRPAARRRPRPVRRASASRRHDRRARPVLDRGRPGRRRTRRSSPRRRASTATSGRTSPSSRTPRARSTSRSGATGRPTTAAGADPRVHRPELHRASAAGRRTRSTSRSATGWSTVKPNLAPAGRARSP